MKKHIIAVAVECVCGVERDVSALGCTDRKCVYKVGRAEYLMKVAVGYSLLLLCEEISSSLFYRLGKLGLFPGCECFAILLYVYVGKSEAHRYRLIEAHEFSVSDLAGHAGGEGKIGVTGAIDEYIGANFYFSALAVKNYGLDPVVFFDAVYYMRTIDEAASSLKHHLLEFDLAVLRFDLRMMSAGTGDRMVLFKKSVDPFLAYAVYHTGNTDDVAISAKTS